MPESEEVLSIAVKRALGAAKNGIGTQSERLVHGTLKFFLEPDEACHEIRIGRFVADVFQVKQNRILEIQTKGFDKLRAKLSAFLPEHKVTVVYPVVYEKYLCWVDPESGEITKRRRSPRRGVFSDILPEIYRLPELWNHPNLDFLVVMMNVEEYRVLDGWSADGKKGSHRMERLPLSVVRTVKIKDIDDYLAMLPQNLPEEFGREELLKALKLSGKGIKGSSAVKALERSGAIVRVDVRSRKYIYQRGKNHVLQ